MHEFTPNIPRDYFHAKINLLLHLFHCFCNTIKDNIVTNFSNGRDYIVSDHNQFIPKLSPRIQKKKIWHGRTTYQPNHQQIVYHIDKTNSQIIKKIVKSTQTKSHRKDRLSHLDHQFPSF